jgi:hypothetical protein
MEIIPNAIVKLNIDIPNIINITPAIVASIGILNNKAPITNNIANIKKTILIVFIFSDIPIGVVIFPVSFEKLKV